MYYYSTYRKTQNTSINLCCLGKCYCRFYFYFIICLRKLLRCYCNPSFFNSRKVSVKMTILVHKQHFQNFYFVMGLWRESRCLIHKFTEENKYTSRPSAETGRLHLLVHSKSARLQAEGWDVLICCLIFMIYYFMQFEENVQIYFKL